MNTMPPDAILTPDAAAPQDAAARERQMQDIAHALRVVYGSVQAHSHRIEQQCGVSMTQLSAMWELHDTPGQKVTELALTLSIHPSNCSNMMDKLRRKGLVRKQRSGPDQRVVRLYLTKQGIELLKTAPRPTQGILSDALQRLPDGLLSNLESSLVRLLGALKGNDTAPRI